MDFDSKECEKLRKKHKVKDTSFLNSTCEELPCYTECISLDAETISGEEQERYLEQILKDKTIKDLIKEIPQIEDILTRHYTNKMFEMKEAEVKKKLGKNEKD